jgi:filamentous hemagglutinin family protein
MKSKIYLSLLILTGVLLDAAIGHTQTYQPSNRIPIADNTLGTQVSGSNNNFTITGGLNRGQNLFHSFKDFSIPTNGIVTFTNPVGNQSIITRVTGNLFSDINGLLSTQGANFFLINPNGIIFGNNAQLNVGKAFVASTANGIDLLDAQGRIYTFGTKNINDVPLLTINPNVFLNVSRLNMGGNSSSIVNYGTLINAEGNINGGLSPIENQYIALIGGDITLDGSLSTTHLFPNGARLGYQLSDGTIRGGQIVASGGRVDLGGLNTAGAVSIDSRGFVYEGNNISRSDVSLINGAGIDVSTDRGLKVVNTFFNNVASPGSSINISANNFQGSGSTTNSSILFAGLVSIQSDDIQSGDININTTGRFSINNAALYNILNVQTINFTNNSVGEKGSIKGGKIKINANSIDINNQSRILSNTFGIGNAGNIEITATKNLTISGTDDLSLLQDPTARSLSAISSSSFGIGNTGRIEIKTSGDLSLINRGGIFSTVETRKTPTVPSSTVRLSYIKDYDYTDVKPAYKSGWDSPVILSPIISAITSANPSFGNPQNNSTIIKTTPISTTATTSNKYTAVTTTSPILAIGNSQGISITARNLNLKNISVISTSTLGKGDAGNIKIETIGGDISLDRSTIFSTIESGAISKIVSPTESGAGSIDLATRNLTLNNSSGIRSDNSGGTGTAGDIKIVASGNILISGTDNPSLLQNPNAPLSVISSSSSGVGDTGRVEINTLGNLSLVNQGIIFSTIGSTSTFTLQKVTKKLAQGNSRGINITSESLSLKNNSIISSSTEGIGNAGNINIDTTGNLVLDKSTIFSTIESEGIAKFASPTESGTGNININTQNLILNNSSGITSANNFGTGTAGDINITTTNNLNLNGGQITSSTLGLGNSNSGNIKIDTKGNFEATKNGSIFAITSTSGDAGDIKLTAQSVTLTEGSELQTLTDGSGKAGDLSVITPSNGFVTISGTAPSGKLSDGSPGGFSSGLLATAQRNSSSLAGKVSVTTGTLNIDKGGVISTRSRTNNSPIRVDNPKTSITNGRYPQVPGAGSITIDAKNINITTGGQISTTSNGNAAAGDIILKNNTDRISISGSDANYENRKTTIGAAFPNGYQGRNPEELANFTIDPVNKYSGIFANNGTTSTGKGGSIILTPIAVNIANGGQISVSNEGTGNAGNIFLVSNLLTLNNGSISSAANSSTGGNINLSANDRLLLRNSSNISTNSTSNLNNGNGGNITIDSPLIVATQGNNDISANAFVGSGGKVKIASQGLFGIQYRDKGQDSLLTSDITASSTFGQNGTVNISTPGIDPGKDANQLPTVPTDASNQISQTCSPSNRDSKFAVTGRGGLPKNAYDLLTSDVVWQDSRAVDRFSRGEATPTIASSTGNQPTKKISSPAIGWVFDGKGKVTLIAAESQGQPTGTRVVCPNGEK